MWITASSNSKLKAFVIIFFDRFTRFFEDYWLPNKFGFDKRRAHFSSLILTGQMTREEAIERIKSPELDDHFLKKEFEYVSHKLGLTVSELKSIFEGDNKNVGDYKNKQLLVFSDFGSEIKKTKEMSLIIKKFEISNSLIILDKLSKDKVEKSIRNIPNIKVTDINHFSAFDIIKYKKIVFTETSVKELEKRFA